MTIGGVLEAMGTRELRANLRVVVEKVEAGNPVVCLKDGQPLAVMISHEEAEHWRKIEDALAALHALDVYPEAFADPSELADLASLEPPDRATDPKAHARSRGRSSRRYGRSAYPTPGPPSRRWSARWRRVGSERSSREVIWPSRSSRHRNTTASAPSPESVSWFRGAGLDLATATEQQVIDFVRTHRAGTGAAQEQWEG